MICFNCNRPREIVAQYKGEPICEECKKEFKETKIRLNE